MPGDFVPNQMYTHQLNVVKGWWQEYAVDKTAPLASGEAGILAGNVLYLDATAKFRKGLPINVMGCLAFPNQGDYDVSADLGNTQRQNMLTLPTFASYELWVTEYDKDIQYQINDYLTAWDSYMPAFNPLKLGVVTKGQPYENTLVGCVSAQPFATVYGINVLQFWTLHLPVSVQPAS